jgi:hypothetical protein
MTLNFSPKKIDPSSNNNHKNHYSIALETYSRIFTQNSLDHLYQNSGDLAFLFDKEMALLSGLLPKNIVLKCGNFSFPLIIKTLSMKKALIIVQNSPLLTETLERYNHQVAIRFYFNGKSKSSFLVESTVLSNQIRDYDHYKTLPLLFSTKSDALVELLAPFVRARTLATQLGNLSLTLAAPLESYALKTSGCYLIVKEQKCRIYLKSVGLKSITFLLLNQPIDKEQPLELYLSLNSPPHYCVVKGITKAITPIKESLCLVEMEIASNEASLRYQLFLHYLIENSQNSDKGHTKE